ncbi:MAG TPA: hypothetical protein VFZ70_01720 [Euzebyales bacterium]
MPTPEDANNVPERIEPLEGPNERDRAFLEERMARMVDKADVTADEDEGDDGDEDEGDDGGEGRGGEPHGPVTPSTPGGSREAIPASDGVAERRREALNEAHARRRAQLTPPPAERRDAPRPDQPREQPPAPPANSWVPIGPAVLRRGQGATLPATSGRVAGLAPLAGGDRIYVGSANGGVWRSEDGGSTWHSLMDAFDLNPTTAASDSLAVGALEVVPGATAAQDTVYVGTGEGASSAYFGVGPVVSTDGGTNWVTEPVSPGSSSLSGSAFYALAVDPGDSQRVVAATQRGLYRREPDGAGGFHWDSKVLPGAVFAFVTSVVACRQGGTTTFYAAEWGGRIYASTDGATWTTVGTGFPTNRMGRISLTARPGDPSVVYALAALWDPAGSPAPPPGTALSGNLHGLYRLDTADGTWRLVTGVPATLFGTNPTVRRGQGSYDNAVEVDPNDANRVFVGGSTAASSGEWSGSMYRCAITVSGTVPSATATYIGASIHADVHRARFTPGDATSLWVGCDGGVFHSANPAGSGNIFRSRNTGLVTLTLNSFNQHPTEPAVVFSGSQDNGGIRYTGEEAWLYSSHGDGGAQVIDWNNPYRVLSIWTSGVVRRSTNGGLRDSYNDVSPPLAMNEGVLFYNPMVGTPFNPASPAQANRVALGSTRVWVTNDFGTSWASIPGNTTGDNLGTDPGFRIRSLLFTRTSRLFAGTMNGRVYRYDEGAGGWGAPTRIDNLGTTQLPFAAPVTDIAEDPADPTGGSIFVTYGGTGDYRHVWHWNGTTWQQRSGPPGAAAAQLLDVNHTAIVVDPADPSIVYAGADIGVWRSTDAGQNWAAFSAGLPDAGVMDLKIHAGRRLLRCSTFGRGMYEVELDRTHKQGIELYVRDTQLDQGRYTTVNGLDDPTRQGQTVAHWRGPGIKLDTPDVSGDYEFPLVGGIDFLDFTDGLTDDARGVATHATATITTKVYVQVHNRGTGPADNVRVMLLLANASTGLPPLPATLAADVQAGTPITTMDWRTVGITTLHDVRPDAPKIADFDLTSDLLPPPANLAGNNHHCVLALLHHANDPFTSTVVNTDQMSRGERKAAHKNLTVVQFTGTVPTPAPVAVPLRLHNPGRGGPELFDLEIDVRRYRGHVRLYLPPVETDGDLTDLAEGLKRGTDFLPFREWARDFRSRVRRDHDAGNTWDAAWTDEALGNIDAVLSSGAMFDATADVHAALRRLVLEPAQSLTAYLLFDRPPDAGVGDTFPVRVRQFESEREELVGGLDIRLEVQPEPLIDDDDDRPQRCDWIDGVAFRGTVRPRSRQRWTSAGWPADADVHWAVIVREAALRDPTVAWMVVPSRGHDGDITYDITVSNLGRRDVEVECRFAVDATEADPAAVERSIMLESLPSTALPANGPPDELTGR